MTTDKPMINKISDAHYEVGAFTISLFNEIVWELNGPQIHQVMSDDRNTLLRIAAYLVNVSQQADILRELFKLVIKERQETEE